MAHTARSRRRPILVALVALLVLGACSSSDAKKANADELAVSVASYDLAVGGATRFIVGLQTADNRLVGYGTVNLRFSYVGTKEAAKPSVPGPVMQATYLPIPGSVLPSPPPTAPQVVLSSDSRGVYSTSVGFDKAGFWQVEAVALLDGKARTGVGAFPVNPTHAIPAPGDSALLTETLTLTTPDTPKAAVDSRAASGDIPDPELHRVTIAAALAAKRPIVAVFATPVYCTSRFCGPITDMVAGLAKDYADRASFVHVEIWRDFQGTVINKSAADWLLRNGDLTEPWVFVIGADGKIAARFDNVASRDEIEPLLKKLPIIGV